MKVIDLLNKIANEELSFEQKFKYKGVTTNIDMFSNEYSLNEEVLSFEIELIEIIEEDKEIEELSIRWKDNDIIVNGKVMQEDIDEVFVDKINELIKAVNELKKGK